MTLMSKTLRPPLATQEPAFISSRIEAPATEWTPADKWLPPDAEPVLATDLGAYYVASWGGDEWTDCSTDEPIDCHITHWRWLPDFPEE